jgi:hypothetical protein
VYDLIDGKISRIRIFLDRQEALKAVGPEERHRDVASCSTNDVKAGTRVYEIAPDRGS